MKVHNITDLKNLGKVTECKARKQKNSWCFSWIWISILIFTFYIIIQIYFIIFHPSPPVILIKWIEEIFLLPQNEYQIYFNEGGSCTRWNIFGICPQKVNFLFILYWKEIQKAQPNLFSGRFLFDLTFSVCILGNGLELVNNCIQVFYLGRYIVRYTVRNLVLRRQASGAVKRDFRTYIRQYTSPNENLNMVIPILMHVYSFLSNWSVTSPIKPHLIQRYVT